MSQKQKRELTESDLKRISWRSIGPALMAGRVSCMCFEPGNPKTFYVGYASGGLWRTTNRGTTFDPIFDNELTSSIGSVQAVDAPANWKGWSKEDKKKSKKKLEEEGQGRIIWVGTGEGNGRNSSSWGHGVYRSVDKGQTWEHLGLEDSHDIPAIAVDPRDPDVCYVAALGHLWGTNKMRGVYKTTDGGKNWEPILQIDENTGCVDLRMDPNNPDVLYAAMYMRLRSAFSFKSGGPKGGIYKSTDGGKNWKQLKKGLPKQTGRIGLDVFPGDSNTLIACVESHEGGTADIRDDRSRSGGFFRSEDGGESWERLSVRTPRAFYFSTIKFDPKDSQRVYQLGWYVEVSEDGGRTFRKGIGNKMHVDMHALLIDPDDPEHMINGSDGGVYQSFDRGKTWTFLNTMAVGQFYNISLDDSDPYRVIGGLQDNGTWVGPTSGIRETGKDDKDMPNTGLTNADWQFVLWGDGFHADFDPNDKDVVYGEWQGGNITRVNLRTGERSRKAPEAAEGAAKFRFNWNSPMFVSKHDSNVLYLGGNHVFRLLEKGDKWEVVSGDLTTNDVEKSIRAGSSAENHCTLVSLAESDLQEGLLWAGSDDGLVHVTEDGGKSWKKVTPKEVKGLYISRIEPSHADKKTAYVSVDGHRSDDMDPHIYMTSDMGATWKDISGDLPKGWSVHVVREDLNNPDVLYCGTENALHISMNRGRNWIKFHGKSLPTTPINDIKQHPRTLDLVLGTHGRSIWVLDDAAMLHQLTAGVMEEDLHLFDIAAARPRYMPHYGGLWTDQIFRAENRPQGAIINYWIKEYEAEPVKITIENDKGVTVAELAGSNAPGLNRAVWDLQPKEDMRMPDEGEEPWLPFYTKPGTYTVKLKMGKKKAQGTVEVLPRLT